jgi:hypothetical protein
MSDWSGDWYKSWLEKPVDDVLEQMLGKKIGSKLGSKEGGLGQEIENWTSLTKMFSDRNPLYKMAKGKYKFGDDSDTKWQDELNNNLLKTGALAYGGYAAGGAALGGGGGSGAGMTGMESELAQLGGTSTSAGAGLSKGTSVQDIMNYKSMLSNQGGGKPQDNQGLNYFIKLQQQKKRELDALLKGDVPLE